MLVKKKIQCIVVDDDQFSVNMLKDYIAEIPRLQIKGIYTNPVKALMEVIETGADLIFLDINMPGISGIQFAENLKHKAQNIIFTTAFANYAVEAFDVSAKHYLLKPIELSKFIEVVTDVIYNCFDANAVAELDVTSFFLRTGERGKLTKVLKSDIVFIQAAGNYVQLLTEVDQHMIYMTIKEMVDVLKNDRFFFRVHKSYIINAHFVKKIIGNTVNLGKYDVLISNQYKSDFADYLKDRILMSKRISQS